MDLDSQNCKDEEFEFPGMRIDLRKLREARSPRCPFCSFLLQVVNHFAVHARSAIFEFPPDQPIQMDLVGNPSHGSKYLRIFAPRCKSTEH